jgi:hypothetical protein
VFQDPIPVTLQPTASTVSKPALDPRLSVRATVHPRLDYVSTMGVSHQLPSFFVPIPGVQIGDLAGGLQTSLQASQGVEVRLPYDIKATATFFWHNYLGLTDITASCSGGRGNSSGTDGIANLCANGRVRGRAVGLELFVKRDLTKRLTGWISYTLSRSTREAHPLFNAQQLQDVPSEFDRTHVLGVVGAYDLGARWRAGARFFYYTGRPYSQTFQGIPIPPYNQLRLPDFWRIDARIEKSWPIGKTGHIALVLEGLNVTANKEAIDARCSPVLLPKIALDQCSPDLIGPVTVPSIGVEGAF